MQFEETPLPGAYVIHAERVTDDRGFFARIWCEEELRAHGLDDRLAQSSLSRNARRGTLRGLHLQRSPHEETKIVRCVRGAIYDVIVDLRADSKTYREWFAIELDAVSGDALYIPSGVAHGFQTLVADADVLYMISVPYAPEHAAGVLWNDPAFDVVWPDLPERILSDRDRSWPPYESGDNVRTRGA